MNYYKFFSLIFLVLLTFFYSGCSHRNITTCFYDFNETLEKRIGYVVSSAPGVKGVRRLWPESESAKKCLCYEVKYKGSVDDLASWIHSKLQTSSVLPFRLTPKGEDRLEIYFDWKFE